MFGGGAAYSAVCRRILANGWKELGVSRRRRELTRERRVDVGVSRRHVIPAVCISILAGVSVSLSGVGFVEHFYQRIEFSPTTFRLAVGAVLISMSLGPRLPRRGAMVIARLVQARMGDTLSPGGGQASYISQASADRNLLWTATGIASLAAGLGTLALPWFCGVAESVLSWGLSGFLWLPSSLAVFEGCVLFGAACLPFSLVGFLARCVHQLACPSGRWNFAVFAWLLLGFSIGISGISFFVGFPPSGAQLMRAGAIPLLMSAILSVWTASPAVSRRARVADDVVIDEPEIGERWPVVLRLAVCVCICAAVTVVLVWAYTVRFSCSDAYGSALICTGLMVAAVSVGVWASAKRMMVSQHRIGSLGKHCVVSGVLVALGVGTFNVVVRSTCSSFSSTAGYWLLWGLCTCVPLATVGHAIGYGGIAVLRRGSYLSDGGARLLRMIMFAVGLTFIFVTFYLLETLGSYATIVAAALAFLATGGILIIHEPYYTPGPSRLGVASVFVAVLCMTWIMPAAGGGWLGDLHRDRRRLFESWWLTCAIDGQGEAHLVPGKCCSGLLPAEMVAFGNALDWGRLPYGCRLGVVTLLGDVGKLIPQSFTGSVRELPIAPRISDRVMDAKSERLTQRESVPRIKRSSMAAQRYLMAARERFDLLIVSLRDVPWSMSRRVFSQSFLERVATRLAIDGLLVIVVPTGNVAELLRCELEKQVALLPGAFIRESEADALSAASTVFYLGFSNSSLDNYRSWSGLFPY